MGSAATPFPAHDRETLTPPRPPDMEFNLGPAALENRPGMINSVLAKVNPDLASYSSYSSTNDYQTTGNVTATDAFFHAVLDLADSKLVPKTGIQGENLAALGFVVGRDRSDRHSR